MPNKKTLNDFHAVADKRGFKYLGSETVGSHEKALWSCGKHEWMTTYSQIARGKGCPHCIRHDAGDYKALADKMRIEWLGPLPTNVHTKTKWSCGQHEWENSYSKVNAGRSCPICTKESIKDAVLENRRKRIPEQCGQIANRRGFTWLGPVPASRHDKTLWSCGKHEWEAPVASIMSGHGCPECAKTSPITESDYIAVAKKHGIIWLGPLPPNSRTKTLWSCGAHNWEAVYSNVSRGSGCPHCKKLNESDYHELAKKRGFTWLGPLPPSSASKTYWSCGLHEWETRFGTIQRGSGCPKCAGVAVVTHEDYTLKAQQRGFTWLGPLPQNGTTKTRWSCGQHEWMATYANLRGCPHCAGQAPRTTEDYKKLAEEAGLVWIGPFPQSTNHKTWWSCGKHEWETRFSYIQSGARCPECQGLVNGFKASRPQRALAEMIGGELNFHLAPYSIDIAFPDERIAIEYDCSFWHKGKEEYDANRDEYMIARGWRVLRIKSRKALPSREDIADALTLINEGHHYVEIVMPDWNAE